MSIIDGHCDVLSKLLENNSHVWHAPDLQFKEQHITNQKMMLQVFAVFHQPQTARSLGIKALSDAMKLFKQCILRSNTSSIWIKSQIDLDKAVTTCVFGAMLSIEGLDYLESLIERHTLVERLSQWGYRIAGLTWNESNWASGSCHDPTRGLTKNGWDFIRACEEHGIVIDAAHASPKTVEQLAEDAMSPWIISHANCKSICDHSRNISNHQLQLLFRSKGMLGLSFVPEFIANVPNERSIHKLLQHLDHICSLGGEEFVGWGSDFDGMIHPLTGLEHAGLWYELRELLNKHYKNELVEKIMWKNWYNFFKKVLPLK